MNDTSNEHTQHGVILSSASLFAVFCIGLNTSALFNLLPIISSKLNISTDRLIQIPTCYSLFSTVFFMLSSRLSYIFSPFIMFFIGIILFLSGLLLMAFSQDSITLILAASIQGLAISILLPYSLDIINDTVTGKQKGIFLSLWPSVACLGSLSGALLGAYLTQISSWRVIFIANACHLLIPLVIFILNIKRGRPRQLQRRFTIKDIISSIALLLFLISLVLILNESIIFGLTSNLLILLSSTAIISLPVFLYIEYYAYNEYDRTFKSKPYLLGCIFVFAIYFVLYSWIYIYYLFTQATSTFHYSPLVSAISLSPLFITLFIFSLFIQRLVNHIKIEILMQIGWIIIIIGFVMILTMPPSHLLFNIIVWVLGAGIGLSLNAIPIYTFKEIAEKNKSFAYAMFCTIGHVGFALGLVTVNLVYYSSSRSSIRSLISKLPLSHADISQVYCYINKGGTVSTKIQSNLNDMTYHQTNAYFEILSHAFKNTAFVFLIIAIISALLCCFRQNKNAK